MCRGAYKTQILERLLCTDALPKYCQLTEKDVGKAACTGLCPKGEECKLCDGFQRLLRFDVVPAVDRALMENICSGLMGTMPDADWSSDNEDDKMTFCSWGDETGKNNAAEMIEHRTTPQVFLDNFMARLTKYKAHIATLRRCKFATQQEVNEYMSCTHTPLTTHLIPYTTHIEHTVGAQHAIGQMYTGHGFFPKL